MVVKVHKHHLLQYVDTVYNHLMLVAEEEKYMQFSSWSVYYNSILTMVVDRQQGGLATLHGLLHQCIVE